MESAQFTCKQAQPTGIHNLQNPGINTVLPLSWLVTVGLLYSEYTSVPKVGGETIKNVWKRALDQESELPAGLH